MSSRSAVLAVGVVLALDASASSAVLSSASTRSSTQSRPPVNAAASAEARALLEVLYGISGKHVLSGQHNYPAAGARNTAFVKRRLGATPAVFSQDWGFAAEGDKDSYLARPAIVEEAKRQHRLGSIVTLCWHAVPPTADEPVVFNAGPPSPGRDLAAVQGRLTDEQWKDLLTPGTSLHERWLRQVDSIAAFLRQLKDARVPVLWRPYHEMNGDWFWWGGRGADSAALYRQIYDRLVNHHGLDNLVWVWSVDRPGEHATSFASVYPGDAYVDVLALDVYGRDFRQSYYDDLLAMAKERPLVLGEVGNPPTPAVLKKQPRWAMYVVWAGMSRSTPDRELRDLAKSSRVLHLEDVAYWEAVAPLRRVAGLPVAYGDNVHLDRSGKRVDFSGNWRIDESEGVPGGRDGGTAETLEVLQGRDEIVVARTVVSEYEDAAVTTDRLALDGAPERSEVRGAPRVTAARWSEKGDALLFESTVTLSRGGSSSELKSVEEWQLRDGGRRLTIRRSSTSPWGQRSATVAYERR